MSVVLWGRLHATVQPYVPLLRRNREGAEMIQMFTITREPETGEWFVSSPDGARQMRLILGDFAHALLRDPDPAEAEDVEWIEKGERWACTIMEKRIAPLVMGFVRVRP